MCCVLSQRLPRSNIINQCKHIHYSTTRGIDELWKRSTTNIIGNNILFKNSLTNPTFFQYHQNDSVTTTVQESKQVCFHIIQKKKLENSGNFSFLFFASFLMDCV